MISIAHPTSNANSRNTAKALSSDKRLAEFWTCLHWTPNAVSKLFLPKSLTRELDRRSFDESLHNHIKTFPYYEIGRQAAQKLKFNKLINEDATFSIHSVYKTFTSHVAKKITANAKVEIIHAYEDGALEIFKSAKKKGITCLYELPIAYWKYKYDLFTEENEINPEWADTIQSLYVPKWLQERKDEELMLADVIIVPSEFVKDSVLTYHPHLESKIHLCAYGAPESENTIREKGTHEKLKVLYVGSLGQRKGMSYLFDVFDAIKDIAEITIIGNQVNPEFEKGKELLSRYNYLGSVPNTRVLQEMRESDVFILPTLCEGQALVNLEAMGAGMTVITTPNSGATDFIENERDGILVPIRDADTIISKIQKLNKDRDYLKELCENAVVKAKEFSWENYQKRYLKIVDRIK